MQPSPHLHTVHIRLDRIGENYRLLCRAAEAARAKDMSPARLPLAGDGNAPFQWPAVMPVIKADAYGHGHIVVARHLMRQGAGLFASGSVAEAAQLRRGLSAASAEDAGASPAPAIVSLLGLMNAEEARLCGAQGIIPVIHSPWQLPLLEGADQPLALAFKFNTGMARLGFGQKDIPSLFKALEKLPHVEPVLALSHLACADTEHGSGEARAQAGMFAKMLQALRGAFPNMAASLANSAGTLLAGEITEIIGPHLCRPGIALYGGNPFSGTGLAHLGQGLRQAMAVSAPVIAVRELPAGSAIGYGHTFRAGQDTRAAIVGMGYADAYPRAFSNRGEMCLKGERAPVIGRVSMQMTAVDVGHIHKVLPGDEAWLLGGPHANALGVEELARLWGTISYEVFCLLGNGARVYSEE